MKRAAVVLDLLWVPWIPRDDCVLFFFFNSSLKKITSISPCSAESSE